MPQFISYLRVSTHRQGHDGLGIEAQRAAIQNYVRGIGGTILEEFVEVESGSVRDRPILMESISQCRQRKAILVIAKLDRLARNVAFVSALMETGVEFVAVDAPFANKLFVHILAAFAEHERLMISERTKVALAAAKARGVRLGLNGARLAERHQVESIEFSLKLKPAIMQLMANGAETLAQIADQLNEQALRSREGARWSPATVQRVLKRLNLQTAAMITTLKPGGEVCSFKG